MNISITSMIHVCELKLFFDPYPHVRGYQTVIYLFDLMLYTQSKQPMSCCDGQLINHTVPVQTSWRKFTSI